MSGWNGSDRRGVSTPVQPKVTAKKKPSPVRGLIAGGLVCALAVGAYFAFFAGSEKPQTERVEKDRGRIKEVKPAAAKKPAADNAKSREREIAKEMNELVKPYIKKGAGTNNVIRLGPQPLDPDDPDNLLRTRVAQDVGQLLSIQPGEMVPPMLVFYFMFEDDEREAKIAAGEKVITTDNGNQEFLDSLKKWKMTIKEGDTEARRLAKEKLNDAHIELLKGIDEGLSVNDSIKAAYQFRVEAAKTRQSLIDEISRLHTEDGDVSVTKELVQAANEKLAAEGIIKINMEEVIEDYEEPEEQEHPAETQPQT